MKIVHHSINTDIPVQYVCTYYIAHTIILSHIIIIRVNTYDTNLQIAGNLPLVLEQCRCPQQWLVKL